MSNRPVYTNKLIMELLGRVPVLNVFSTKDLRRMLYSGEFIKIVKYRPNEVIIFEGDYEKRVYVLIKGAVKVVKDGVELCVLRRQGDVIGEMGAMRDQVRSATVTAVTETVCISINIQLIERLPGEDKSEFLGRMNKKLSPLIEKRTAQNREVAEILFQIRQKEAEIDRLKAKLRKLEVVEDRSLLDMILEEEPEDDSQIDLKGFASKMEP